MSLIFRSRLGFKTDEWKWRKSNPRRLNVELSYPTSTTLPTTCSKVTKARHTTQPQEHRVSSVQASLLPNARARTSRPWISRQICQLQDTCRRRHLGSIFQNTWSTDARLFWTDAWSQKNQRDYRILHELEHNYSDIFQFPSNLILRVWKHLSEFRYRKSSI